MREKNIMATFAVYSGAEGAVAKALAKAGIEAEVVGRGGDGVTIRVPDDRHRAAMAVVEQVRTNAAKSFPAMTVMAGIVLALGAVAVVAPVALGVAGPYIMAGVIVLGGVRMLVYGLEWVRSFKLGGAGCMVPVVVVVTLATVLAFLLFAVATGQVWGVL
jgi:hypothetical protein